LVHGIADLAELSFGKRPAEELYDLKTDPEQLVNVAGSAKYRESQTKMREQLFSHLAATKDPRVVGGKVHWDYYPYYGLVKTKGWSVDPKPKGRK
jgi:hypothetical protein